MLSVFFGTDTKKLRDSLNAAVAKAGKGKEVIRVTDAHTIDDLRAALQGAGMFGGPRVVVLDATLTNEAMREIVLARLPELKAAADTFYIYEGALDAATRKQAEKYAEEFYKYDAAKAASRETIFNLVRPLQDGKKKDLWVAYQREILAGKAPEAIHGMLFYAAKDSVLRNPNDARARRLVAQLAELPHEARRQGFELEYALERFVLANV